MFSMLRGSYFVAVVHNNAGRNWPTPAELVELVDWVEIPELVPV
jgi:hypothetical protein